MHLRAWACAFRCDRRASATIIATAIVVAATMATAAPAGATNVGWGWGLNNFGQLGDGTATGPEKCPPPEEAPCSLTPVEVSNLSGVRAIAAGGEGGLGLLESGTVMAWGAGLFGQLGDGSTEKSDVPVEVKGLSGVTAISAGARHGLAVLSSGSVMAWGQGSAGQLGDGSMENSDVPVEVKGLSGVVAIAAGARHSLALLSNGTVMAWGENAEGQLGDGSTEGSDVPVEVKGLSGVTAISAGQSSSLALLSNGTVVAWGRNTVGQLGDGGEANSELPVAVCAAGEKAPCAKRLESVTAISAGGEYALALLSNGTVVSWGRNNYGQLGNASSTGPEECALPPVVPCAKSPVAVHGLAGVSAIAGGFNHSLALLSTGSVLGWGGTELGQLGDGSASGPEACSSGSCSTQPIAVSTRGIEHGIAAGASFSLAFGPPPPAPTPLPELGRCVKVAKTGAFGGTAPHCITIAKTHKGNFEWFPGPGAKPGFKETLGSPKLETVDKTVINCTLLFVSGQYTGAKSATVSSVALEGCEETKHHLHCENGPLGKIENTPGSELEAQLGFIVGGEKPQVGWDLKPKGSETTLLSFKCGTTETEALSLEGSVIGHVLPPLNGMVSSFGLRYTQKSGLQIPERFEGGLKDTLLFTRATVSPPSKTSEPMGLATEGAIESEEELEIKAKV